MVRNFISYTIIIAFVWVEPGLYLSVAHASSAQKCQQHKQKIKQNCSENTSLKDGATDISIEALKSSTSADLTSRKRDVNNSDAALKKVNQECSQANDQCSQDCEQAFNEAAKKKDTKTMTMAKNQKEQCQKEKQEQEAKNNSAMADLAKLLQAIAALLAALMGDKKDKEEIAKEEDKKEEEDVCKTPEGAVLLKCQGESDPLRARASLSGMTGVGGDGGGLGQTLARPAEGTPTAGTASTDGSGAAASGGGLGGGFAAAGGIGSSAADIPVQDAEKGKEKDIYNGFHDGGGGGGGSSGGGGQASSFQPFKFDDPFAQPGDGEGDKKAAQAAAAKKSLAAAGGGRGLANASEKGGIYQDNFAVVKKAYGEAKGSLEY